MGGFRESLGGERDALHAWIEPGLRGDCEPGGRGERGGVREQGRRVSVRADAEQDESEGDSVKLTVVFRRRALGSELGANPVHGGGWMSETGEQRLLHEPEVRALVVRGDAAFVPPPELGVAPVAVQFGGELIRAPGSRAAREDDVLTGVRCIGEEPRGARGGILGIGGDDELDAHVCTVSPADPGVSHHRAVTAGHRSGTVPP